MISSEMWRPLTHQHFDAATIDAVRETQHHQHQTALWLRGSRSRKLQSSAGRRSRSAALPAKSPIWQALSRETVSSSSPTPLRISPRHPLAPVTYHANTGGCFRGAVTARCSRAITSSSFRSRPPIHSPQWRRRRRPCSATCSSLTASRTVAGRPKALRRRAREPRACRCSSGARAGRPPALDYRRAAGTLLYQALGKSRRVLAVLNSVDLLP